MNPTFSLASRNLCSSTKECLLSKPLRFVCSGATVPLIEYPRLNQAIRWHSQSSRFSCLYTLPLQISHTAPTFSRSFHLSSIASSPRTRGTHRHDWNVANGLQKPIEISLSERAIRNVFSGALPRTAGNELLSKLQRNRQLGRVDDRIQGYDQDLVEAALRFLRRNYSLDEDAAIIARVDQEFDNEFRIPQTETEHSRSNESKLKELKKDAIEREKREKSRKDAETQRHLKQEQLVVAREQLGKAARREGKAVTPQMSKDLAGPSGKDKSPPEWLKRYYDEATDVEIPTLTMRARLVPGGLFTIAVVLLSLWFADTYIPPSPKARLFPDTPPAAATCLALITINVVVFLLWRVPPLWSTLNKYFINLPIKPRAPQLLLATFSHQHVPHLTVNLLFLWLVGVHLHDNIGRGPFLALVYSSAVIASYTNLVVYVMRHVFFTATCGASAICTALVACSCMLHEGLSVKFSFLPPEWTSWIDTGLLLAFLIGHEMLSMRRGGLLGAKYFQQHGSAVDHVGHLAGYGTGIWAGLLIRKHDPHWRDVKRDTRWRELRDKRMRRLDQGQRKQPPVEG